MYIHIRSNQAVDKAKIKWTEKKLILFYFISFYSTAKMIVIIKNFKYERKKKYTQFIFDF